MERREGRTADEADCCSRKTRHAHEHHAGERAAIKTRANRRDRREIRQALKAGE
jgi:hypothetical protein